MNSQASQRIVVCCLSLSSEKSVEGILQRFQNEGSVFEPKFVKLSPQDLDSNYSLPRDVTGVNAVILLHSISEGRFSLTNVVDARYDKLLPSLKNTFGANHVGVIAHALPNFDESTKDVRMMMLRNGQPTTFACSECVILCGLLAEMPDQEWRQLVSFLKHPPALSEPDPPHSSESPTHDPLSEATSGNSNETATGQEMEKRKETSVGGDEGPDTATGPRTADDYSTPRTSGDAERQKKPRVDSGSPHMSSAEGLQREQHRNELQHHQQQQHLQLQQQHPQLQQQHLQLQQQHHQQHRAASLEQPRVGTSSTGRSTYGPSPHTGAPSSKVLLALVTMPHSKNTGPIKAALQKVLSPITIIDGSYDSFQNSWQMYTAAVHDVEYENPRQSELVSRMFSSELTKHYAALLSPNGATHFGGTRVFYYTGESDADGGIRSVQFDAETIQVFHRWLVDCSERFSSRHHRHERRVLNQSCSVL